MNLFFRQSQLDIIDSPSFSISRQFDFFVITDHVLMTNKLAFESLLNHKNSYQEAYAQLKQEPGFVSAIANMAPIDAFVGTNATQLRRMAVIRERGYYNNSGYLSRVRSINDTRNWGIQFDDLGRIIPTEETMRAIMHILLNHRLHSELTEADYDVPSTSLVS